MEANRASAPSAGCMLQSCKEHFIFISFLKSHVLHSGLQHACSYYILPKRSVRTKSSSCTMSCVCAHTQRYTDRSRHFKAFAPLWGKEAAWQTPACRIKTYHLLSFSLLQTRGFCMGLAEPGLGMLFIYFICYQKLGRHKAFSLFAKRQKPLVRRTTIRCKLRSDGFCCLDAESLWFMI